MPTRRDSLALALALALAFVASLVMIAYLLAVFVDDWRLALR